MVETAVAVTQITSTNDVKHNLEISEYVVRGAAAEGAKVIFLPEAADFITNDAHECFLLSPPISRHAYTIGLQALAKELSVTILAGIHDTPEETENNSDGPGSERVFNSQVVIGPDGSILDVYRKIHLFDVALTGGASSAGPNGDAPPPVSNGSAAGPPKKGGESSRIRPGMRINHPVQTEAGKIGLEICYDIRFPELHTVLTRLGAQVISIPAAFTLKTGKDHWRTLVRAMAIQFQVYVVASAQAGAHNPTRSSWGESLIYSPWGVELAHLNSIDEELGPIETRPKFGEPGSEMKGAWAVVEFDLEGEVGGARKQIPLAIQKRDDVYGVVGEKA